MKINWNYIKFIGLLSVVVFLYAFTSVKRGDRKIEKTVIEFVDEQKPFITHETVSKLLVQNKQPIGSLPLKILNLHDVETILNANKMVENAEVYLNVHGVFSVKIKQKQPIARVLNGESYYIDSVGEFMPLSSNYAARVPVVTGNVSKEALDDVFVVAKNIERDAFLKKYVVEIHQNENKLIELKLRKCKFTVQIGRLEHLEKKINNLKAFYIKALRDKSLNRYSKVNLQFENQVICTKV